MAGAPGVEPGSEDSQSPMLSVTPCPFLGKLAKVPGFEPGSRDPKPLMLSATPYLLAASQATAAAPTFGRCAASPLKPRSVALTAMTEGPLQRILFIKFWYPHVSHLSGLVTPMEPSRISLSVK